MAHQALYQSQLRMVGFAEVVSYTPPKSSIYTKNDGFLNLYLLSNMAIWDIHVSFRRCRFEDAFVKVITPLKTNMTGWKISNFNRKYSFKWWVFHSHVSFSGEYLRLVGVHLFVQLISSKYLMGG